MSVSICIPTYNYGHLIGKAIASVLEQGDLVSEILILDNASTDNTQEIVSAFKDPRIRYSRNASNLGFAGNLQRGFEQSSKEFLQFLCADDFLYPGCLEQTLRLLKQNPEMSFAHTGHDLVDKNGRCLEQRIDDWKSSMNHTDFLSRIARRGLWGICLSSALIRRKDLQSIGGIDTSLSFAADYGMWLGLCLKKLAGYIAKPLTAYRVHESQATSLFIPNLKRTALEKFLIRLRQSGISIPKIERALKMRALNSVMQELPRRRIEGESIRAITAELNRLRNDYGLWIFHPRHFFHFLVSILPRVILKKMHTLTH